MRPIIRIRTIFGAGVVLAFSLLCAAGCIDAVLSQIANEIRLGKSTPQDLDTLIAYTKNMDPASDTAKGLISAISSRAGKNDGAKRAAQIIFNFSGSQDSIFSALEPFKGKDGFGSLVAGLGSTEVNTAFGSSEELRFATSRLGADNVNQFQVALDGTVPDIQDINFNLYEVKARNYAGEVDFLVAQDLGDIHDKAVIAISQLPAGKTLTLAFDTPLTPSAETLYQAIFKDLIPNPNFIRINGF
jgi:hypothetical protein